MTTTAVSSKSTVFVAGGGGNCGKFVVDGLLKSGHFHVVVLTRPKYEGEPRIQALKQKGVEIRLGDLFELSVSELEGLLRGIDIVLSIVGVNALEEQRKVFQAAKNVGVKRVVPSDFTLVCPLERGHQIANKKQSIKSFIKELGIDYTFIDVGWWMDLILPHPSDHQGPVADISRIYVDTGDVKTAVTSRADIGHFVARILADPRTLNSYVFCHAEEVTKREAYRIAEEVNEKNFESLKTYLTAKTLEDGIAHEKEKQKENPLDFNLALAGQEYLISAFVFGDNTLETAKGLGALDARTLYPDFKPTKLKEFAVEFSKRGPTIQYDFF